MAVPPLPLLASCGGQINNDAQRLIDACMALLEEVWHLASRFQKLTPKPWHWLWPTPRLNLPLSLSLPVYHDVALSSSAAMLSATMVIMD